MAENRQILQHLRTSGSTGYVQENLKTKAKKGEIAIQYDGDGASGTSLWTLAKDKQTAVQFVNKEQVADMIKNGAVEEVDRIEAAVGLADDGTYRKKSGTNYLNEATSVEGEIDALDRALNGVQGQIHGMDKAADVVAGQVVTTISEADGKVSEVKANVKDLQLGGYEKTDATGAIAGTDTINAALSKLENKANAITISNTDGSINVTPGADGTVINVNIKEGERVIKNDGGGLYTNLNLVKISTGLPTEVKERYELHDSDGVKIGESIDIAKDSHIVSITYITDSGKTYYQNLEYKYIDVNGVEKTEYVDISSLVLEAEFKDGLEVVDHQVKAKIDATSEKDSQNTPVSFLTVGPDGLKLSGIKDEITRKIEALNYTDTPAAGQYVTEVNEADGKISVVRANVSEAVLNNYVKGSDATAVVAADSVNAAISKIENQIDKAKAAATTKVVEGADEGNNMTIVSATSEDESVTYTVSLTDVASKAALDAEIAARKAVDGQTGETYVANANSNYIKAVDSLNAADVQLDAILGKDESAGDGNTGNTVFDKTNTVAKNISDIKKDLAKFKSKLTLSGKANAYAEVSVVTAETGTTIEVSAKTQSIATSTKAAEGLADAYDVKTFAIKDVSQEPTASSGVKVTTQSDGNRVLDFSGLKIDCGEF